MTDPIVPPTKRTSRRRPTSAPQEPEPPTVPLAEPVEPVGVPPVQSHETGLASAAMVPKAGALVPETAPIVAAPPVPEPSLPNSPFKLHDVVQITDKSSRHYGQFFTVGDVSRNKVHGYYMMEGMKKDYVTIEMQHCFYIGTAKVRSANPASPKWLSDKRP